MIITSCGNSIILAKRIAKKLNCKFSPLTLSTFPDGDIYLKYNTNLTNKKVVIVCSFQPHPDMALFDIVFAAETAKDLGAKKVILAAPYLGYMRQDKRFHPGECVSSKVMAKLLNNSVDKLITIDPHLHRYKSLKDIFTIPAVKLTANNLIADYVRKHFKNEVVIGPDWESYQWAENIAKQIHVDATVLKKKRFTSRQVKVKMVLPVPIKGKEVIIVDDIISTGHTVAEAAKQARKMGAHSITAIGVHGLFVEEAIGKLNRAGVNRVVTTNCIEHPTNKIDVATLIVDELVKEKR
ncbi:MAG TPA: ribose-phosphate diphosphokinase [Candidatus Nanoarchaeia archaeon]|nr:ribose-phosphate diphosphokinase [Candidatus Nanoarchaeia archaeon]